MAGNTLETGRQIFGVGEPLTSIHLITKGSVLAEYPGGSYHLGKGDVIGISEICSEVHILSYTASEDTTIFTYSLNSLEMLGALIREHPDVSRLFLLSLFRQITLLLEQISISEMNCAVMRQNMMEDYTRYNSLCSRYRMEPQVFEDLESTDPRLIGETADLWLGSYYQGLQHVYASQEARALLTDPGVSMGNLRKGSLDFIKTVNVLEEHYNLRTQIAQYYFNSTNNGLFDLYAALYAQLGASVEDSRTLYAGLERMIRQYEEAPSMYDKQAASRIHIFRQQSSRPVVTQKEEDRREAMNAAILAELSGSLDTILEFSGLGPEKASLFRDLIDAYKALEDRNSMEAPCARLRRQLTEEFYLLYSALFKRSLTASALPAPVRLFLYFGYVDEGLAGTENSITLYLLASHIRDTGNFRVYTFYHWLLAIYNGKKIPGRNEFDEDFLDYLHKEKSKGRITASQMSSLEADPMGKVDFELKNVFPQVNKITFGRITTFCPVFTADNVMKELDSSYVTVTQISKALETIKSIDYSAFYRESMDYDHINVMGKELIHLEYLPDVILMPNVGIRGSMWQEIEGKRRNSPARMFLSIFHMEGITTSLIRLTGEFRWEMCKRIQGSRWNDLSERSLTSEYTDYIQFYRKNRDLSREAKEKLRTSLQRAKNSFREMFVRDYIVWILFEGNGSPRLNKVARKILFTYCPFSSAAGDKLAQNPAYTELLDRQKILAGQKLHRLDMLTRKLSNSNIPIPETIIAEQKFFERKV